MLSILIPTYNYDVVPLVVELQKQCIECEIEYEILCQDDASNSVLNTENEKINGLINCFFYANTSNLGRGKNRNYLAEKAKYNCLLFMDCDTFPTGNNFIYNYILEIKKDEKIVFGGITYKTEKPETNQMLRWIYGKKREAIPVEKRNKKPNESALTSNLLIEKQLFISNPFDDSITKYGYEDLVFLSDLKKKGVLVKHIENPTYHLGLETSKQFLDKTKTALENLNFIVNLNSIEANESKISRIVCILKQLHLVRFVVFIFKISEKKIEKNLLSEKPSLLLFDLYKLGYFCSKLQNSKTSKAFKTLYF